MSAKGGRLPSMSGVRWTWWRDSSLETWLLSAKLSLETVGIVSCKQTISKSSNFSCRQAVDYVFLNKWYQQISAKRILSFYTNITDHNLNFVFVLLTQDFASLETCCQRQHLILNFFAFTLPLLLLLRLSHFGSWIKCRWGTNLRGKEWPGWSTARRAEGSSPRR